MKKPCPTCDGTGEIEVEIANGLKSECIRGHPFDSTNTYVEVTRDGKAKRHCRACWALRQKNAKRGSGVRNLPYILGGTS